MLYTNTFSTIGKPTDAEHSCGSTAAGAQPSPVCAKVILAEPLNVSFQLSPCLVLVFFTMRLAATNENSYNERSQATNFAMATASMFIVSTRALSGATPCMITTVAAILASQLWQVLITELLAGWRLLVVMPLWYSSCTVT